MSSDLLRVAELFLLWLPKLVDSLGDPMYTDELVELTEFVRGFLVYHGLGAASYLDAVSSGSYSVLYMTPDRVVVLNDFTDGTSYVLYDGSRVVYDGELEVLARSLCGCMQPPCNNPEYRD